MTKLTHEEITNRMIDMCPNIKMLSTYKNALTKTKYYCIKCNKSFEVTPNYFHSKLKYQCPHCLKEKRINKRAKRGINDLWTTNPDIAKNLLYPNEGYNYSHGSSVKLDWKCPDCGNIIHNKKIIDACKRGLGCPHCKDGYSFPSKLFANILIQLEIDFETEKSFKWIGRKRYDFYIKDLNTVVEIHGSQHYFKEHIFRKTISFEKQKRYDLLKKVKAIEHGLKYVEVDCRNTDLNWLKKSMMSNKQLRLFIDFDKINWNLAYQNSLKSKVIETCQMYNDGVLETNIIAQQLNISSSTVWGYLHIGTEIGICNYDNKKLHDKKVHINSGSFQPKEIICLTTGNVFNSISEANRFYGTNYSNISACCKNTREYSGLHPVTRQRMIWMYYEDYINCLEEDIHKKIEITSSKGRITPVKCITTGELFDSLEQASKKFNIKTKQLIKDCCDGKREFAGKLNDDINLTWDYIS